MDLELMNLVDIFKAGEGQWFHKLLTRIFCLEVDKLLKKNENIIDLGCGHGFFIKEMNEKGYNCSGIDLKPRGFASKPPLNKKVSKGNILSFRSDEKYDCATLIEVLEHIPNYNEAIKTAFQILKPKGILLVSVPNKKWGFSLHVCPHCRKIFPDFGHLWRFDKQSLKKDLYQFFRHVEVFERCSGFWFSPIFSLVRMVFSKFSIFEKLFFKIDNLLLGYRQGIYLIGIAKGKKMDKKKLTPNATWFKNSTMYSSLQKIIIEQKFQ